MGDLITHAPRECMAGVMYQRSGDAEVGKWASLRNAEASQTQCHPRGTQAEIKFVGKFIIRSVNLNKSSQELPSGKIIWAAQTVKRPARRGK